MAVEDIRKGQCYDVFVKFNDGTEKTFKDCSRYYYLESRQIYEIVSNGKYNSLIPREAVQYMTVFYISEEAEEEELIDILKAKRWCSDCKHFGSDRVNKKCYDCFGDENKHNWEAKDNGSNK